MCVDGHTAEGVEKPLQAVGPAKQVNGRHSCTWWERYARWRG